MTDRTPRMFLADDGVVISTSIDTLRRVLRIWRSLRARLCARWQRFAAFVADVGCPPAGCTCSYLHLIDASRGYVPGNCRWRVPSE